MTSLEKAVKIKERSDVAVMICGDITTKADPVGYEQGTTWLRNALQLDKTAFDSWHVAIGNHDLDRSVVDPDVAGVVQYTFARKAWNPYDVLALETPRMTSYSNGGISLRLTTLNSCVGSGAHRMLPDSIRSTVLKEIAKIVERTKPSESVSDDEVEKALELV
jgi:hypothetical protein